jgi:ribosomal protein L7/L12
MTIRIECEASDLQALMDPQVDLRAELAEVRNKLYEAGDRERELSSKVDDLSQDLRIAMANPRRPDYAVPIQEMLSAFGSGQKILAIKFVKEMTGLGLKESKDLVEAAYATLRGIPVPDNMGYNDRRLDPRVA